MDFPAHGRARELEHDGSSSRRPRNSTDPLVIDPSIGAPAEVHFRTVAVAAASCLDANIASTASIVRGEDAVGRLRDRGLPSRLVTAAGNRDPRRRLADRREGTPARAVGRWGMSSLSLTFTLPPGAPGRGRRREGVLVSDEGDWDRRAAPADSGRRARRRQRERLRRLAAVATVRGRHPAPRPLAARDRRAGHPHPDDGARRLRADQPDRRDHPAALGVSTDLAWVRGARVRSRDRAHRHELLPSPSRLLGWRAIHWLAYVSWPVAVLHGLGTGSDSKETWALAITLACVIAVVGAVIFRVARTAGMSDGARTLAIGGALATVLALAAFAVVGPPRRTGQSARGHRRRSLPSLRRHGPPYPSSDPRHVPTSDSHGSVRRDAQRHRQSAPGARRSPRRPQHAGPWRPPRRAANPPGWRA